MSNDPESKRREDLRLPCSSHHVAEQQKGEWVPQGLSSLWQIRAFLYSDGGSQGHFSGWQGHLQYPSGLPQPLMASGPPFPSSRLGTCLSPTLAPWRHFQIASPSLFLGKPWGAPHCPGRNPKLLGPELQAPPAPSLPVPLGLTHICTHTCIPPTATHTHHPHSHTCIHSQYMHIYSHILLHTHTHTYLSTFTHMCSPLHTHSLLQMHTHALIPPISLGHTHTQTHMCTYLYNLHVCTHMNTPTQHTCMHAVTVYMCTHASAYT